MKIPYALRGLLSAMTVVAHAQHLTVIPSVPFVATGSDVLDVSALSSIVVDAAFFDTRDTNGQTLIPPTLEEFADTFSDDLKTALGWDVPVEIAGSANSSTIFLTLGDPEDYLDAAGRPTSEGYSLDFNVQGITITGASPLGVWWGTRTLLQHLVASGETSVSLGRVEDSPGWGTRGLMLDVARHYYPVEFLQEMCAYMSFYKQNTFHIHLSDNLWNNVALYSYEHQLQLYAAFRLWSDDPAVEGLNKRQNESYTREQFDGLQRTCAARGVTILPEIEAPGHALVISQWKPDIALPTDMSLLNISHPDTIPTVKTIWEVFLPWFHSKTVHMGADEYRHPTLPDEFLASEYTRFVDEINDFIVQESNGTKTTRIWGTFAPKEGGNTDKAVSVQHWAPWEANPQWDFIENGYDVLNSGDRAYIVGKWSEPYPQELNLDFIFHADPSIVPGGGPFAPHIFDQNNVTNNAAVDSPSILGHIAAQWNDFGPNATTVLEAFWQWRDGLGALADKQWGGDLAQEDYEELYAALSPRAPGQNLERRIPSVGSTIVEYDFATGRGCDGMFKDLSGNGYHAKSTCGNTDEGMVLEGGCVVTTPLGSKGRNYTLSFGVKPTSSAKGAILKGPDSELWFGNGTSEAVMLFSGESAYALNYTFPVGEWTNASLVGRGRSTYLNVGEGEMEFLTILGWEGNKNVWTYIGIEAPVRAIGDSDFEGIISHVKLVDDNA